MIIIKKYTDLIKFIEKFKEGFFDLLIIVSRGGLGKTYNTEKILGTDVCKINSHVTPQELFAYGYIHKDKLIWFDDVEAIFNNTRIIGLMKQFCQTEPEKDIKYISSRTIYATISDVEIPQEYETKSKVLLLCNSLDRINNNNIKALLDRGVVISFEPTKTEMIKYIKESFENVDMEIINFIKKKKEFSLRDYIKANQMKSAEFSNWKELLK